MKCTLSELRSKEIISLKSGTKLGYADDIEFETDNMTVKSLIIYGRLKLFGLLGRDEDMVISGAHIEKIGTDTILVSCYENISPKESCDFMKSLCR